MVIHTCLFIEYREEELILGIDFRGMFTNYLLQYYAFSKTRRRNMRILKLNRYSVLCQVWMKDFKFTLCLRNNYFLCCMLSSLGFSDLK